MVQLCWGYGFSQLTGFLNLSLAEHLKSSSPESSCDALSLSVPNMETSNHQYNVTMESTNLEHVHGVDEHPRRDTAGTGYPELETCGYLAIVLDTSILRGDILFRSHFLAGRRALLEASPSVMALIAEQRVCPRSGVPALALIAAAIGSAELSVLFTFLFYASASSVVPVGTPKRSFVRV